MVDMSKTIKNLLYGYVSDVTITLLYENIYHINFSKSNYILYLKYNIKSNYSESTISIENFTIMLKHYLLYNFDKIYYLHIFSDTFNLYDMNNIIDYSKFNVKKPSKSLKFGSNIKSNIIYLSMNSNHNV